MLAVRDVAHVELDADAKPSTNERMRSGTRRPSRPSGTRFVAWSATGGTPTEVDLVGSPHSERLVRTLGVVPVPPKGQLAQEVSAPERDEDQPSRALGLERPHQAFDDGDAAVLTDGAEAVRDSVTAAPPGEVLLCELKAMVGDQVVRSLAGGFDNAVEEGTDRLGGRLLLEYSDAHHAAREVILNDGDEPAEWPEHWDGVRKPRHPEANVCGNGRDIGMPDMVRPPSCHDSSGARPFAHLSPLGLVGISEHPTNRCCAQMKPSPAEDVGDASLAEGGEVGLEESHDHAHELRILVDGHGNLDERVGSFLVEALVPVRDRKGAHEKACGGLGLRPAACGAQLQDRKSFDGRVVRPPVRWDRLHASVFDAHFLPQQFDLAAEPLVLSRQPDAGVIVVLGQAAGMSRGRSRQGDGVDDGRADAARPSLR